MIDQLTEGGTEIPFPGLPTIKSAKKYKPYGDYLRLDYEPEGKVGGIILPGQKSLEFVTCPACEVGPECKLVKKGDMVLLATKAIMKTVHDGVTAWFTKESAILAVIEGAQSKE